MLVIAIYMLLVNSNSIVQLYAYGTNSHTIRVRLYHMRIRVRYVPYAYGMEYAYGTQHKQFVSDLLYAMLYELLINAFLYFNGNVVFSIIAISADGSSR